MNTRLIAALPLLALASCTSRLELAVVPPLVDGKQIAANVPNGIPYVLYFDRFSIETSYQIVNCSEFALKAEPTVAEIIAEPDPDQTYYLNPNSLAGPLKTSIVAAEYNADGSIASINAKAEDRTAETVGAFAKTAASVIKIAGAGGGLEGGKILTCNQPTLDAFKAYNTQKVVVTSAKAAIDAAQAEFDAAKAKVDATSGPIPKPLQTRFNNAWMSLDAAVTRLASAKAQLAKLADPITLTVTTLWPDSGSETTKNLLPPAELDEAVAGWTDESPDLNPKLGFLVIELKSAQAGGMGANGGLPRLTGKDLARGLPYRSPVRGILSIRSATNDGKGETVLGKVLFEKTYSVRQLGRVFQLPCVSKPFTSISCSLAFNDKGQLTKAGTENSKAPLEGAAGLLGSVVDSGGAAVDSLRVAADKRNGAAMNAKQEELAVLDIDAKLAAARKAASGSKTEQQVKEELILGYETDLKLINARKALETSQGQMTQ